jgi:hypothetical protein
VTRESSSWLNYVSSIFSYETTCNRCLQQPRKPSTRSEARRTSQWHCSASHVSACFSLFSLIEHYSHRTLLNQPKSAGFSTSRISPVSKDPPSVLLLPKSLRRIIVGQFVSACGLMFVWLVQPNQQLSSSVFLSQ